MSMKISDSPLPIEQITEAFDQLVRHRRATQRFLSDPVPDEIITKAITLAGQAPSGYNFQPWRFLLLTDAGRRARLREAAYNQPKITEAPLVVVAFGQREGWKQHMDSIIKTRSERMGQTVDAEKIKATASGLVANLTPTVWLNRQVMIGFTHLMLAFESLGWDTAPMEGFDGPAVKKTLQLPDDADVVALLAVGRGADPEPRYPGRLSIGHIAFRETCSSPFVAVEAAAV